MGTIVEASVPAEGFALLDAFETLPDARVESVPLVAHGDDRPLPLVRASTTNPSTLESVLSSDPTVSQVDGLTGGGGIPLLGIEWAGSAARLLSVLVEDGGVLLSASGRGGRWDLRLLFPDDRATSAAYDRCRDHGVDLSVRRVQRLETAPGFGGIGLSERQHEAIAAAFETDYYGVPRGVTLEGLARELGVSHQALSERLRRGHRTLVANTLGDTEVAPQRVGGRLG